MTELTLTGGEKTSRNTVHHCHIK